MYYFVVVACTLMLTMIIHIIILCIYSMNSGHPAGLFPRRPGQGIPAAVIANGNIVSMSNEHLSSVCVHLF
jgi:hypothetical protein